MRFSLLRFINIVILTAVCILSLTGVYGLFWSRTGWIFDLHRAAGWILVAAIPSKIAISWASLRRGFQRNFDRGVMLAVSILLSVVSLLVIGLGIAWMWRIGPAESWLRQTLISWHWMLALGLLAPLILHAWRRWPHPKRIDFTSRRGATRLLVLGGLGLTAWLIADIFARQRAAAARNIRRSTGSREDRSFSGNQFAVTNGPHEGKDPIEIEKWRLTIQDRPGDIQSFDYPGLLALPQSLMTATLDCTLGWFSTQEWQGVRLDQLIDLDPETGLVLGVKLVSASGYAQIIPVYEARQILLATHVGNEPLDHWHGFPLRAVLPSRRGWFWVKWLTHIQVVEMPELSETRNSYL